MSKRFIFACLLFALGAIGVIAMIAIGTSDGPATWFSDSMEVHGWFAVIIIARAVFPFVLFCLMSIAGLLLCALELISERKK